MASDWLDGGIARMTNTTSEFGRELDSLADIISFGIAPAILAYTWGVQFVNSFAEPGTFSISSGGPAHFSRFCFLVCGAARLARFNIPKNPQPGIRANRIANISSACRFPQRRAWSPRWCTRSTATRSPTSFPPILWLMLLALLSFLMISTWRYWSFKDLNLLRPRTPLILVVMGIVIYGIWYWSQPVLLILAVDLRGQRHRHPAGRHDTAAFPPHTPKPNPETQIG